MRLRDNDGRERLTRPSSDETCPNCMTRLVAVVERGPTHNVYECAECQRSFARRRVP